MFHIPNTSRREPDRHSRREALQAATSGLCGLAGVGSDWNANAATASSTAEWSGFGRAKRCLLLYVYGAWSQLDTFDPKPNAPSEIRGEFSTIDSCLPGVQICEHLPKSARVLDRGTLVRSMAHPWNIHSASYTLTGNANTEKIEGRQRHPDQWPFIGSVVDHLARQEHFGPLKPGTPTNVMLPWRQSLFARPNKRSGTFGAFLGTNHDPLWTEFHGEAPLGDPFRAITPDGRFTFGTGNAPPLTPDVLARRQSLLSDFERHSAVMDQSSNVASYVDLRERAIDFLATSNVRDALSLEQEPFTLRENYGMTLFGQACLTARRLLEADVKFVTVVWDEYGQTDESWDTHYDHHSRMKEFLLPGFDSAFSTLMTDLDDRGMLDDTLVLCLSEHGRTPRFDPSNVGAPGRGHWSRAYSQLFAGAGIPRGQVIGETDAIAGDVVNRPINPKDVLCTAYHLLGVDPRHELLASPGRPVPLVAGGRVIRELL